MLPLEIGLGHSRPGASLRPVGLVLHSTADPGATARQIRDYFNTHRGASTHLVVDWTEIVELIPWEPGVAEIAWHAGPTANMKFLSIEWCETTDQDRFAASYSMYIDTIAKVLMTYNWPADIDHVWSHAKVSATFKETDHQDPLPYLAKWGKTWGNVMDDVAAKLRNGGV